MKRFVAALFLLLALGACSLSYDSGSDAAAQLPPTTPGTDAQQAEAVAAARGFLALIDARDYDKTWDRAGSALKASTNEFMWTSTLKAVKALGTPDAREVEGLGFTTRVDVNAPVGEYVMVQFKSGSGGMVFTEKVVMQKENGAWGIVGYFATKRGQIGPG